MSVRDVVQAAAGVGGGGEYIEDVFSTYLYNGTGSAQTINNGIDLDGEGGLVWVKWRSGGGLGSSNNALFDTVRGVNNIMYSDTTMEQQNTGTGSNASLSAFNNNGFSLGPDAMYGRVNYLNGLFASWTFRKSPKFFDVVTYTGTGASQIINHSLDSVPGMMFIKKTSGTGNWVTLARQTDTQYATFTSNAGLNLTAAANATGLNIPSFGWISSTGFNPFLISGSGDGGVNDINASETTYVAYLFAHNAGGFGDDGEQNVISCGSLTADNAGGGAYTGGATVNLGYEPQFVLLKQADSTLSSPDWMMLDIQRGYVAQETSGNDVGQSRLKANTSGAEDLAGGASFPISTGFSALQLTGGATYIYIAIRRPMKTPESGTEVFAPSIATQNYGAVVPSGFPVDMYLTATRTANPPGYGIEAKDRLRGKNFLATSKTDPEGDSGLFAFDRSDGVTPTRFSDSPITLMFRRAPGFFDVVAYTTETGSFTRPHNLGVAPEIMILKNRGGFGWYVMSSAAGTDKTFLMETSVAPYIFRGYWPTDPDASNLYLGGQGGAYPYIAYLFASLAGISKCGSYIGTGADLNVDCGFSSGARFVLIKRYDGTPGSNVGDWYVWDSARGIVAGNDPYLLLNSAAAEVTSTDYIDPLSSGFTVTSSAPAALNASGGSYIFLAIA